jgi:DNA-binding NtrC family response regulator
VLGPGQLSAKLYREAVDDDGPLAAPAVARAGVAVAVDDRPLRAARAAFERRYVAAALARHGDNVSQAAKALGVSRVALHRKMKDFGLR